MVSGMHSITTIATEFEFQGFQLSLLSLPSQNYNERFQRLQSLLSLPSLLSRRTRFPQNRYSVSLRKFCSRRERQEVVQVETKIQIQYLIKKWSLLGVRLSSYADCPTIPISSGLSRFCLQIPNPHEYAMGVLKSAPVKFALNLIY